ncbi:MAG TPA: acetyl-CoA C-acetyltransferase [Planctomycetota bacterium]|jgi:acetyl-CoA C-acetyltransferase|nr:acetyl-CoA C-acetyltransferase [Planctomycetota bacterium]
MRNVFITSACRTPVGKFLGALSSLPAPELGAIAVREAVRRSGIGPEAIEEVIVGCVLQAGLGQAPARQVLRKAGIPDAVGAFTVNKVCGSSLKAAILAAQAIRGGDADVVVAAGMESMSNAPYLLPGARTGMRLGDAKLVDSMIFDGLWDPYNDIHMGSTGELVAEKYGVSRGDQDAFAVESHRRAVAAERGGKFAAEVVPVTVRGKKGEATVAADEGPRPDASLEVLARLKPAFKEGGTVTAGNASTINDGAAALVLMSEEKARALGARPLARVLGYATGGLAPEWVMMAPTVAIRSLCARTGLALDRFELVEINEAFAAQMVALRRELAIDPERLNVNGGAIALGHPIGASGARILTTLLHAMADRGASHGLAALCLGGGNAVAMAVERA